MATLIAPFALTKANHAALTDEFGSTNSSQLNINNISDLNAEHRH